MVKARAATAPITGIVFDIKELALHDGPGIRTTVFLKGCPLCCRWCHNPEGLSPEPQVMRSVGGRASDASDGMPLLGERIVGRRYGADELAAILNGQATVLAASGGGVTFSGGEPLMQAPFLRATIDRLEGLHVLLDTSGYAGESALCMVVPVVDLVYYDLKLMDPVLHRHFTGVDNAPIHRNLRLLASMGIPYVVRVPLIPGVTDTPENLDAIARFVAPLDHLAGVDLLPYNRAAGGKYVAAGVMFCPGYDEDQPVNADTAPFEHHSVPVRVR